MLILTLGQGVDMFVLEPTVGNFGRVAQQLQMPARGKTYSVNEANPMAFILEQAGGCGSTGADEILDFIPDSLHQRVPVILGSRDDVAALKRELAAD